MSSFSGKMREYDLISVDRFDGRNLESSVYFLSHNHADHTIGLDSSAFLYHMSSNSNLKLYCSHITRCLLLLNNKYKSLKDSIVELEVNEPHTITVIDPQSGKERDNVTVTLLPAEHCPGSVMFLFEGSEGTVLYTGDFRLTRKELLCMRYLHSGSSPKDIKSLYVDTTFCIPQATYIPDRDDSVQAIIDIIQKWISISDCHIVNIRHKAILGYENLFKKVSLHFNMKVHVDASRYEMYRKVGDMTGYTTPDPNGTQIHACKLKCVSGSSMLAECCLPAGCTKVNLRSIAVSTMCFVQKVSLETYAKRFSETFYRVCYSFHPSYCEVRDMILYLQPHQAFANVIPVGETMDMIQQRIDHFVNLAKQNAKNSPLSQHKCFGRLKVRKRKMIKLKLSQQSDESSQLQFGDVGESPVKCKRYRMENNSDTIPAGLGEDVLHTVPCDVRSDLENMNPVIKDSKDLVHSVESSDESNDEQHKEDIEDFTLQLSLSQDDNKTIESFIPKLQDSYGSLLGYISETDSDDILDNKYPLNCNVSQESGLTLERSRLSEGDSSSSLLANGNIKSKRNSATNGANQLAEELPKSVSNHSEGNSCSSSLSAGINQVVGNSSNSVRHTDTGSSSGDEPSDKEIKVSANALKGILEACKNASLHSSDVILLEDDHNIITGSDEMSQEKTSKNYDQPQSESQCHGMEKCSEDGKKNKHMFKENGKSTDQGPVTCTIDLTEMDEDDDVYPSTSAHEPRWYNYHGQNLFSQFSHPSLQQVSHVGTDQDDEMEYSEKEVACSDEECECGGKSKGGTHKYMVPRPKKPPNKFVPFQINWQIDSEGSDEDSLLELPAHVRTRKWIESQSLYMQRRHYLNSQVASSSEVIVIDSDDEESEQETNSDQKVEPDKDQMGIPIDKTDEKQPSEKTDDSEKISSDKIIGDPSSSRIDQKIGMDDSSMKQQHDNSVRETANKEKDSLSADQSLASCPTNLSILAQASDMSLKNSNVNDITELQRTVNGDSSSHVDNSKISPHRQIQQDDKGSSS